MLNRRLFIAGAAILCGISPLLGADFTADEARLLTSKSINNTAKYLAKEREENTKKLLAHIVDRIKHAARNQNYSALIFLSYEQTNNADIKSVVKTLVDNGFDAEYTHISNDVNDFIRVSWYSPRNKE